MKESERKRDQREEREGKMRGIKQGGRERDESNNRRRQTDEKRRVMRDEMIKEEEVEK